MLHYEPHSAPLLPWPLFVRRFLIHSGISAGFIVFSLVIGMTGYHTLESLDWTDAFLNAAMILGGMGPVDPLTTVGGKIFAGIYAIYSGVAFLLIVAVLFTPVIHRFIHKLHIDEKPKKAAKK